MRKTNQCAISHQAVQLVRGDEGLEQSCFLRVVREDLSEEVTFKQRSEGTWGKSIPGRWNSQCKGPVAGACLAWGDM